MPAKMEIAVFTTVEVLSGSCKPGLVPGKIEKAIFTTVEVF